MKIRVLQGHSICFCGIWFNQGDVVEVPEGTEFLTTRPKYDGLGKLLGQETVSQVEQVEDHIEAANAAPEAMKEEE